MAPKTAEGSSGAARQRLAGSPGRGRAELLSLGLDAEAGRSFYSGLKAHEPGLLAGRRRLRADLEATDLSQAGWGAVFPRDVDPAIVEALGPLLDLRRHQAGDLFRRLSYIPREGPGTFLSRLRAGPGPVAPSSVPYYLLLVGSPKDIPHGFQFDLDLQYATGRLDLPNPEAYAAYARSLVASEGRGIQRSHALRSHDLRSHDLDLFSVGHGPSGLDPATDCARRALADPLERALKRRESFRLRRFDGMAASKNRLQRCLTEGAARIVMTVGHAALFQPDNPRLRPCQGALVCSDWPGQGPAYAKHYFAASDVPDEASLAGRIFVLFGCHTAGTPRLDSFGAPGRDRRAERRLLAHEPFLAKLPQRLLAHPKGGAAAVVAHVDRAMPSHRFGDFEDGQSHCFEEILVQLLKGRPVGLAMEAFSQRHGELAARLVAESLGAGDGDFEPVDRLELWSAYCDARSHIVLGDPAATVCGS